MLECKLLFSVSVQELSDLHITTEGQLNALEMDLQTTRTALTTLRDRNGDLGKDYQ